MAPALSTARPHLDPFAVDPHAHADGAIAVDQHPVDLSATDHAQVLALARRLQVPVVGRHPRRRGR
jgi:hypothetical protein